MWERLRIFYAPDDAGGGGADGSGGNGTGGPDISTITVEQVGAYLDANGESDAVRAVLDKFNPLHELSDDNVDQFIQANPVLLKHRNSYADQQVTKGITSYKEKHFDADYLKRYNSEHPPETEEAKKLRDLESRLEASERERSRQGLEAQASKIAAEKGIPTELVPFLIGDDEMATAANISLAHNQLELVRQKVRDEILDRHGRPRVPAGGGGAGDNGAAGYTPDQLEAMSMDEINAKWDEPGFQAAMADYKRTKGSAGSQINRQ